jgi:hypothetical protein
MSVVGIVMSPSVVAGLAAPPVEHAVPTYHQEVGEAGTDVVDFAHFEVAHIVPFNVGR